MIFIDGLESLLSCNKFVFFMPRRSIEVEKNYTWPFILSFSHSSEIVLEKMWMCFPPFSLALFLRSRSHALLLKIEILILIRVCRAQQLALSFETSGSRHLSKALTSSPSERENEREGEGEKRKSDCSMNFSFSSHADNRDWWVTVVKEHHEYGYMHHTSHLFPPFCTNQRLWLYCTNWSSIVINLGVLFDIKHWLLNKKKITWLDEEQDLSAWCCIWKKSHQLTLATSMDVIWGKDSSMSFVLLKICIYKNEVTVKHNGSKWGKFCRILKL